MISGEKRFGLSADEISFYRDNGYLLVEGLLDPEEAALFRQEAHDLIQRVLEFDERVRFEGWKSSAKITDLPRELLHCHNVQYHSAAFSRLISDPRLTDRVADLIGPNIQLHHTKLFIKPPETGAPFPMHQDVPYFLHEKHSMMSATIHFDDAPVERGCIRVVPGSHKLGQLQHLAEGEYHLPLDEYPLQEATPCPARAGDVLLFSYLTIHGSAPNTSDSPRTSLLVQMRDPTDMPVEQTHLSRGQGVMLRGVDPLANASPAPESENRIPGTAPPIA